MRVQTEVRQCTHRAHIELQLVRDAAHADQDAAVAEEAARGTAALRELGQEEERRRCAMAS